ncbi:MAG: hypothetical protein H7A09_03865 [Oceanospirillaceae bacterium]|nr:hypothetical protein [Oceanospirillaceae bacterium]MCP5335277.1 hypothetical protein [Oceanospirillaceae bacterium]MCP5350406.1 hypothetical protein [Oceanospirillaceae bacterium]
MDSISSVSAQQIVSRGATSSQQSQTSQSPAEFTLSKPNFKGDVNRGALPPEEALQLTREYSQRADRAWGGIVETTYDMRSVYADVQSDLLGRNPSLLEKDWDFTVDSKGELLIVEGKDQLTKREIESIIDVLEEHGVDDYMKDLAENIVERGIASRGPEMRMSEQGIGSYDITMDNMSDVLRGRELMNDTKIRPVNRGPSSVWQPIEAYNQDKLDPLAAVMKQVSSRADNVYEYSRVKPG